LHHGFFGPQDDGAWGEQLLQDADERFQALGHGQGRRLDRQAVAVAIDNEAAELVGFTEDEAGGCFASILGGLVADAAAEVDGGGDSVAEEGFIERFGFLPSEEADANAALAVLKATGNELAFFVDQIDDLAVEIEEVLAGQAGWLNAIDGGRQDPRMPTIKWQRLAWLQDHAGDWLGRNGGDGGFHVRDRPNDGLLNSKLASYRRSRSAVCSRVSELSLFTGRLCCLVNNAETVRLQR
jgi:hypothetical protein